MEHPHWQYFLALDADLHLASRYVEICEDNFSTYSIEFVHLLLVTGSEVDVVAKAMCEQIQPGCGADSIDKYRNVITAKYPNLCTARAFLPRRGIELTPWNDWKKGTTPSWWHHYNGIKHERNKNYPEANLGNCISALAGLLLLLVYHYHADFYGHRVDGWPTMLSLRGVTTMALGQDFDLPDLGKSGP